MPLPLAPTLARAAGSRAAAATFGLNVNSERAALARKLHSGGLGANIAKGLPGLTPQQQTNLRADYLQSMDLSADPRLGAFKNQQMKAASLLRWFITA